MVSPAPILKAKNGFASENCVLLPLRREECFSSSVAMKTAKRITLHGQLTQSLVAELASGAYAEGRRFLSNRKICRLWNVSETTAKRSLACLVRDGFLAARDRSGYYVQPGAQKLALLSLHREPAAKLPLPLTWDVKKFQLRSASASRPIQIAVILGGQTDLPVEGVEGLPMPHRFQELNYAASLFQEASRHSCHVRFYVDTGNAARRRAIAAQIIARPPAGVIAFRRLLSYAPLRPMIAPIVAANLPVVTVFDDCEQLNVASININNIAVGYEAARRLLRLGHRRIAVLLPRIQNRYFNDRAQGARMALADAGRPDARLEILRLALADPIPPAIVKQFCQPDRRPTAVIVTVASLFRQLWPVVQRRRLRVPRDLSIVMCAGRTRLPEYQRSFDTLKIDFAALGRLAFTHLMKFREGRLAERALALDLSYVRAGSTWKPPPTCVHASPTTASESRRGGDCARGQERRKVVFCLAARDRFER